MPPAAPQYTTNTTTNNRLSSPPSLSPAPAPAAQGNPHELRVNSCTMKTPFVTTVLLTRKGFWGMEWTNRRKISKTAFLNNARKDKIVLTIYLMSGVKLSGRIKSFDKYSLVLETNNQEQLIFKHAISTVVTQKVAALLREQSAARCRAQRFGRQCSGTTGSRGRHGGIERHRTAQPSGPSWSDWIGRRAPARGGPTLYRPRSPWKNWPNSPAAPAR